MDRNRRVVVRGAIVLAAIVLVVAVVEALTGHGTPAGPGPAPSHAVPGGPGAPAAGTAVCGQPLLRSPWHYTGPAGTYQSGTAGLPTFGSPGTDFPRATSGTVVPAGDNTAAGGNATYRADHTVIYFEPGVHTLRKGIYTGTGTAYVGGYTATAGYAILDGKGTAGADGSDTANADETWEYLTVRNFGSNQNGTVLGNVNGAAFSSGNTYRFDTIGPNEYNAVWCGWAGQRRRIRHLVLQQHHHRP